MVDIHCHRVKAASNWQILSVDIHQIIECQNSEFQHLLQTADRLQTQPNDISSPSNFYFSLGVHPWFLERQDIASAMRMLNHYRHHPRLLAVGECGLDKTIPPDLSKQIIVFRKQIELAEGWQKPLVIHCVRAFNELTQIKKAVKSTQPWIIHGFNNNPQLAEQLLKQDCYLSLGKALLQKQSNAAQVLQNMPLDRLFLETDDASDISISAIYDAAAKMTGLTIDALRQRIFSNFKRVFFQ